MEVRVSLEDHTHGIHTDLAELTSRARNHSKRELVRLIEKHQEELVEEMCGPRYSRSYKYRRGSSNTKKLITSLVEIRFKVKTIIRRIDGKVCSPILEALDVKRRKYSRDVRMKCVEFASKMSYGDASTEFECARPKIFHHYCDDFDRVSESPYRHIFISSVGVAVER